MSIQNEQIKALLEEPDMIAALSNVTAAVKMNYSECNWVGFYRIGDNELVLGPFQGLPACTHIAFTDGVCGKTYRTKQTQRVGDVRNAHIGNVLPIEHAAWHNIGDATTSVIADNLNCLQIMHAHAVFGLLCPRWTTNNTRNAQNNDKLKFKLNHFLSIFE